MKADEFNKAKELVTKRAVFKEILEKLAQVKSDTVEIKRVTFEGKGSHMNTFTLEPDKIPTSINGRIKEILAEAHVVFEATVSHKIKKEIEALDEEFAGIPCTKK